MINLLVSLLVLRIHETTLVTVHVLGEALVFCNIISYYIGHTFLKKVVSQTKPTHLYREIKKIHLMLSLFGEILYAYQLYSSALFA